MTKSLQWMVVNGQVFFYIIYPILVHVVPIPNLCTIFAKSHN